MSAVQEPEVFPVMLSATSDTEAFLPLFQLLNLEEIFLPDSNCPNFNVCKELSASTCWLKPLRPAPFQIWPERIDSNGATANVFELVKEPFLKPVDIVPCDF